MIKTLSVFGTRPEAIKMAPLALALASDDRFDAKICVTAQHRQMLDQVLDIFSLKPDFDLDVMKDGQGLAGITSSILLGMEDVYRRFRPDIILVHGDTTTTLAASISAYYQKIPVAHIEAGLRTGNIYSPWPEEANRKIAGSLAALHFSPTESAKNNLLNESVDPSKVFVSGNTVIDALYYALNKIDFNDHLKKNLNARFSFLKEGRRCILVTGHRRESLSGGLDRICQALLKISTAFPEVDIVYPVHLNPAVRKPVYQLLSGVENIHLIEPLAYLSFIYLMSRSYLVLTDSGGIQEEAPALGKPVLVMRDSTERVEALYAGTVKLVGTSVEDIFQNTKKLLMDDDAYRIMSVACNPYGNGDSCKFIVETLAMLKKN